jgi:hypothetical protein
MSARRLSTFNLPEKRPRDDEREASARQPRDRGILGAMAKPADKDESLKRLGAGRWQTRDERFTIEPQSGTWVVVDSEQTDDLGLARVRGPFGSLTAAKEAIGAAREAEPAESPLAAQLAKLRDRPRMAPAKDDAPSSKPPAPAKATPAGKTPAREEPPAGPRWIQDLGPAERRTARQLIERLTAASAPDPEGMAKRDIVGKVPAVASFAIAREIATLGKDATALDVVGILADGQDTSVGVRWRLVDGDDRPILLDLTALKRQRTR